MISPVTDALRKHDAVLKFQHDTFVDCGSAKANGAAGSYLRYTGDTSMPGKGEILVWQQG